MQQMASDIFVRILRGMEACRKKPAQPASGTLSWMTPSETFLRLCLVRTPPLRATLSEGARAPQYMLKHHESICSPRVSFKEAVAQARRNWFDTLKMPRIGMYLQHRGASSKKMAYETCSSQNVQAHPEV